MPYNILIMGASYGSLLASKILFGGHHIHLVCLPAEADLINAEGFRVRLPVRGRKDPVELDSRKLPGKVTAGGAAGVKPENYDLIGLAMQEPQYRSPGVRELLDAVARSRVPCMSIMNMPPLPYIKRIPGLNYDLLKPAYTDPSVWDSFDPERLTLCSPDPQAIRPPDERSEEHTSELQSLRHLVGRLLLEKKKTQLLPIASGPNAFKTEPAPVTVTVEAPVASPMTVNPVELTTPPLAIVIFF